jgi:hypothetical protein
VAFSAYFIDRRIFHDSEIHAGYSQYDGREDFVARSTEVTRTDGRGGIMADSASPA